jgi:hypothetical protein
MKGTDQIYAMKKLKKTEMIKKDQVCPFLQYFEPLSYAIS